MSREPTHDVIVQEADRLFYESGYEGTSFADIAEAVGISRGNFYYHFKAKDQILDAVISKRLGDTQAMLDGWAKEGNTPLDRIICFIRVLIMNRTKIMAFGCPVGSLNSELAKLDHGAKGQAAEIFGLFRDWLAKQFSELGYRKHAKELALHLLGRSQGIAVMANTFQDEAFIRSEVALLENWVRELNASPQTSSTREC